MLDICLLGTGGMMPLPDRWLTSLLVRYNGKMILIDCGEGTQIPLKIAGWGFKAIDAVLFTHYHADHIAGLPGLLLTIGNSGRVQPLVLIGPPGLKKVVEGLRVISPELPFDIEIIELTGGEELSIYEFCIKCVLADHNITCLSYSVELKRQGRFDSQKANELNIPVVYWKQLQKGENIILGNSVIKPEMVLGRPRKGIKVCYVTDTRPTKELAGFIKDADLFVCEGMYADSRDNTKAVQKKHMMFTEAGMLAKEAGVKELWLTHYSPSLQNPAEFIDTVKNIFPNTHLGHDLLKKSLKW